MKVTHFFVLVVFPLLCQALRAPLFGSGFIISFEKSDFPTQGITTQAVMGSELMDSGIQSMVAQDSYLEYDGTVKGGKVCFKGGIKFSKQAHSIAMTNFVLDIKSGRITSKLGATAIVQFGSINLTNVEITKYSDSTMVHISTTYPNPSVSQDMLSAINKQLGTQLPVDEKNVDVDISFDVDLVLGAKINTDLIVALKLDADIDPSWGVSDVRHADFVIETQLM